MKSHVISRRVAWPGLLGALLLSGCASWMGPSKPKPLPLEPIASPMAARSVWTGRIDAVRFPLSVVVTPGVFTAVGGDGSVVAIEADTGRELWRGAIGAKIAAGVGSDGRFAAAITTDGELVTLEAGRVLWRKPLSLSVTTAPLVAGERVFVLGVDRSVQAFDAQDGTRLWSVARPGDPLSLSHGGVISAFKDTLLAGQGPRLAGLDPANGNVRWEVAIGAPRGTNEVERLADLVHPVGRVGDVVCARSFQASVGCVNAERGALVWTRNVGGTDGVAVDEQLVIGADATDRITAWKTANGDVSWSNDKLLYRELGAPQNFGKAVVFGDSEGTVHFLSRENGSALLRLTTDGSPIAVAPAVAGSTLLVVTRSGGLFAFRAD